MAGVIDTIADPERYGIRNPAADVVEIEDEYCYGCQIRGPAFLVEIDVPHVIDHQMTFCRNCGATCGLDPRYRFARSEVDRKRILAPRA